MRPPNLSIGMRLALGFGTLLVVFVAVAAWAWQWSVESAAVQARYRDEIEPRRAATIELERAILHLSIDVRTWLLAPGEETHARARAELANARVQLERLAPLVGAEDRDRYARLRAATESWAAVVGNALAAPPSPEVITRLPRERDFALAEIRAFRIAQDVRVGAAFEEIERTRDDMRRGYIAGALLTLLTFAIVAFGLQRAVQKPVRALVSVASALQSGDWRSALALAPQAMTPAKKQPHDEVQRLSQALGNAVVALERREQRLHLDVEVGSAASVSLAPKELASAALAATLTHVGAELGVVYGIDRDASGGQTLRVLATHAISDEIAALVASDGIPRTAVQEHRPVIVRDIPADTPLRVPVGDDAAPPRAVAALPLQYGDSVYGVLLVASLRDFEPHVTELLDSASRQLAHGLHNATSYTDLGESSRRVQAQNDELQAQQKKIQAQNETLQHQHEEIQSRNRELHAQADALRAQSVQLADADRRKSEFLSLLAHELRNPIAPISNSLHILRRSSAGGDAALRAQDVIERQSRQLTRLIEDLLDFTRLSEGRIRLRQERVDFAEIVRATIDDNRAQIEQEELRLDTRIPSKPLWVDGDPTRLAQIVGNLLGNAIKFTDGGGWIAVTLAVDGTDALLSIADSGVGIDALLLPQLFRPFSEASSTHSRGSAGLGLGLSLVKSFVEMHGGTVYADSRGVALGACFSVRLPLVSAPPFATGDDSVPITTLTPSLRRVLIVEDNRDIGASLRESLTVEGFETALARGAADGLELAREFRPQLILCDIGMPGMDGYGFARAMRADPQLRTTLLFALSGFFAEEDRARSVAAGFDAHFAKPLDIAHFLRTVHQVGALS